PPAPILAVVPGPGETLIAPRGPGESVGAVVVLTPDGFPPPADAPLYVRAGRELLAIDIHANTAPKPVLFALPVDYLEHALLCGHTLVVPDMERVFAVDYRTGAPVWELPNPRARLFDSLGVTDGVLHVWSLPNTAEGSSELLGVEPLTGVRLFTQTTGGAALKPKANGACLLRMTIGKDGGASIAWIDPVTGENRHTTTITGTVLKAHVELDADSLSARLFPQGLCADDRAVFVPIDSTSSGSAPALVAFDRDGRVLWQWRGTSGCQLRLAALRGGTIVVGEGSDRHAGRVVLLDSRDGTVRNELTVGHDAVALNWDRSWLPNPAPAVLAFDSFADADRTQHQFVCCSLDPAQSAFAVNLGPEDGEVLHAPVFGADFVLFLTRKPGQPARLHALALADRSGLLEGGKRHRLLAGAGKCEGMSQAGAHLVISSTQGLLLLGPRQGTK
ncbi:MAG: PQQ-binding-like beta-propeller repeat protein, partial [Planctomycetota bacterium]